MLKYVTAILITVILFVASSFPQSKKLIREEMRILKEKQIEPAGSSFYSDYLQTKQRIAKSGAALQDLMFASYDWIYNDYVPNMLVMHDITGDQIKDPIAIGIHNVPTRHARIAYVDDLGPNSYPLYGTDSAGTILRNGWNSMIILDAANNALYAVTYDFLTDPNTLNEAVWAIDLAGDITAPTKITSGYEGGWPRMTLLDNGEFWSIDAPSSNDPLIIRKSTNGGVSFEQAGVFGNGDPTFWFNNNSENGGLPSDPLIEGRGSKISIFGGIEKVDIFEDVFAGITDEDSVNCMYHYYSTDAGVTWNGEIIELDGKKGQIANRPDQWSIIEFWDVGDFVVDPTGVSHLIHVGTYSAGINSNGDTINVSPMYYWNDRDKDWLSIADPALEYNYEYPAQNADTTFPANMNGNSAPTITVSDDGQVVAAVWVIPEYAGPLGTSRINVYPGDGGANSSAVWYTDLVYAYSENGGVTWSKPKLLENQTVHPEQWPVLSPKVEINGNQATIHYMYYMDPIPGSSIVGSANSASANAKWVYNSKTWELGVVSVDDNFSGIKNYSLEQNYPNPFNPSTDIKFTLSARSNVSLKVFDVLGREVANLVDGSMEAGSHSVNFNAPDLASGVYLYTINADNFTMTKKMMLMK